MVQLSVTSFIEFLGGQGAPVTAASGKGVLDARLPLFSTLPQGRYPLLPSPIRLLVRMGA